MLSITTLERDFSMKGESEVIPDSLESDQGVMDTQAEPSRAVDPVAQEESLVEDTQFEKLVNRSMSSFDAKDEAPKEESTKDEAPKEESTKDEAPKEVSTKDEASKEAFFIGVFHGVSSEAPKEESPKFESPAEESSKGSPMENSPKSDSPPPRKNGSAELTLEERTAIAISASRLAVKRASEKRRRIGSEFSVDNCVKMYATAMDFPIPSLHVIKPLLRQIVVPREILADAPAPVDMTKVYASVDLIQPRRARQPVEGKPFEVLDFHMPTGADEDACFRILKDTSTGEAVVIFRKVGALSNFADAPFRLETAGFKMAVGCSEIAFLVARCGFTLGNYLKKANAAEVPAEEVASKRAAMIDLYSALAGATKPGEAVKAGKKTPEGVFDKAAWDEESLAYMFTVLLLKFTRNKDAFAFLNYLRRMLYMKDEVLHVQFLETEDPIWGSNMSSAMTFQALCALDELTPTSVMGQVQKQGGQNKLGIALGHILDLVTLSHASDFESFASYVRVQFWPLVVAEESD